MLKSQAEGAASSNTITDQEEELVGIGQDIHSGEVSNCQYKIPSGAYGIYHGRKNATNSKG